MLNSGIVRSHMFRLGLSFEIGCMKLNSGIVRCIGLGLVLSFANWLCEVEFWYCERPHV
jgi:hypothetical protein